MRLSLFFALLSAPWAAWAGDPVIGTWKLNVEKSRYIPGPAPRSQVRVYEAHQGGLRVTITTIGADGRKSSVQHPLNYDGKEYVVSGASQADAILLEKVDDYTSEATLKHAGKVMGTNRRVVSQDGKRMTITYEGTDSRGNTVKNTAVYDK